MPSISHLAWIPAGALAGFPASFVFGDRLVLPLDLYYLIYFVIVLGFLAVYMRRTHLDLRTWFSRRVMAGLLLGIVVGAFIEQNVLSRPGTEQFCGVLLGWAILWRGLIYGAVDGSGRRLRNCITPCSVVLVGLLDALPGTVQALGSLCYQRESR